ncbi:hypothetical protein ACTXT7_016849, partial [Hymenolepis weldensis]
DNDDADDYDDRLRLVDSPVPLSPLLSAVGLEGEHDDSHPFLPLLIYCLVAGSVVCVTTQ